jgi:hypothetical protein
MCDAMMETWYWAWGIVKDSGCHGKSLSDDLTGLSVM